MEWIDVYDAKKRLTGQRRRREERSLPGEYHLTTFAILVNSENKILLTLRDPHKRIYPNVWGHTGGAVQAGENRRQAIVREVFEETGIRAKQEEFVFLWTDVNHAHCSFTDLYLLHTDTLLENIRLQPGETVDARWVTFAEFEELMAHNAIAPPDTARWEQIKAAITKA